MDKEAGKIRADRFVALPYPENYGYVPDTLADDGDPLDVFLISEHVLTPGTIIKATIIGMVPMLDNGEKDHKLLAVFELEGTLDYEEIRIKAIRNFLTTYKNKVELEETVDEQVAEAYLDYCISNFKENS